MQPRDLLALEKEGGTFEKQKQVFQIESRTQSTLRYFLHEIWLHVTTFYFVSDKIPVKILFDVIFRVFRFYKVPFKALTSSFITF